VTAADELGDLKLEVVLRVEFEDTVEHPRVQGDPRPPLVTPRTGLGQALVCRVDQVLPWERGGIATAGMRPRVGDSLVVRANRADSLASFGEAWCFAGVPCCPGPGSASATVPVVRAKTAAVTAAAAAEQRLIRTDSDSSCVAELAPKEDQLDPAALKDRRRPPPDRMSASST
jgi:hypothetical protein